MTMAILSELVKSLSWWPCQVRTSIEKYEEPRHREEAAPSRPALVCDFNTLEDGAETDCDGSLTTLTDSDDGVPCHGSCRKGLLFPATDTLIIFDWDDTLFPTTWLLEKGLLDGLEDPAPMEKELLRSVANSARELLQEALKHGWVMIITNGIQDWVQNSCARFMPELLPLINQLSVVSARSTFEPLGISSPTTWKARAFASELEAFGEGLIYGQRANVLQFGDSMHEHYALMMATRQNTNCVAKSIKFAERPSALRVVEEHARCAFIMSDLVQTEGDLTIDIEAPIELNAGSLMLGELKVQPFRLADRDNRLL